MKHIALLIYLFLILGCNTSKVSTNSKTALVEHIIIDGQQYGAFASPNLIRISPNFYADQTEVTNTSYKEYMYWMKMMYGQGFQEYVDNTIRNVAEMVDNLGITKGGDWKHDLEHAISGKNTKQNIPNCWTGFRNVGKLEVLVTQI